MVEADVSKQMSDYKVEYLVCCIGAFAQQFHLTNEAAYRYLYDYKGLAFLEEHYEAEHTFSIEDAVEDLVKICHRHGGEIQ